MLQRNQLFAGVICQQLSESDRQLNIFILSGEWGFDFNFLFSLQMEFSTTKEELIAIVNACQTRSYSEEVDLLKEMGQDIQWMYQALLTSDKQGISTDEVAVQRRKTTFGSNQKTPQEPDGFFKLFCNALEDFTLRILLVSACLSIILHTAPPGEDRSTAWIEGFAILVAVFVCALVTAANDYQKERQFMELNSVADEKKKVTVRRDGIPMEIHQDFVLVGDMVIISEGMEIPADGILFESSEITTDQSAMTGEADPIHKNILKYCIRKKEDLQKNGQINIEDKHEVPSPIMMSGTRVLSGQGKMIVLVVGQDSCIGKVKALLEKDQETQTPLQQKLQKVATDIGKFGLYSAIIIFAILILRFLIFMGVNYKWNDEKEYRRLLDFFILGITVVVVAIPEGLPLSVTLSLAFSVKKMLKDQNLVRKMEACETMGGANNICSDKTGTLTMNKMELTEIWNNQVNRIDVNKPSYEVSELSTDPKYVELFQIAALVNSTAILYPEEKGSSTEISLLKYFSKMSINYEDLRSQYEAKIKFPFSSSRKRMSIVIEYKGEAHLFIKGASEIILQSCNEWYNSTTREVEPITKAVRTNLNNIITKMAENSLRTLCLAYKKLAAHDNLEVKDAKGVYPAEKEHLIMIAVIGVRDNPRKEVPDAIRKCHRAGITVRMVTGDNIITAKAIAKDIGIISEGVDYIALEGPDFNKLVGGIVCKKCRTPSCDCPTDAKEAQQQKKDLRIDTVANAEQFDKIQDKLLVLARSRPEDKYTLVTGLKERGNVVAVTGDGTNDAPALKKADVGFAMGQSGTQVAREAAAIILIDDNFNSIVKAVLWGRNIYDSIRKFIQFQLTVNVVAVFITLVGAVLIEKEVLKPIQMLWINLIMDTLASLALATEQPAEELLNRKPHSREDYIISKTMMKHIIGQAIFQIIIMMILVFAGEFIIPEYRDDLDMTTFAGSDRTNKWRDDWYVRSGRFYFVDGTPDYKTFFQDHKIYSRHFTFIFNTFVMMQVFNFMNARKLHEEFNIFEGITRNPIFLIVVISIFAIQAILITFAGFAFGVYPGGLTIEQWFMTIGFGSISLLISALLKCIPIREHVEQVFPLHEQSHIKFQASRIDNVNKLKITEQNREQDSSDMFAVGGEPKFV